MTEKLNIKETRIFKQLLAGTSISEITDKATKEVDRAIAENRINVSDRQDWLSYRLYDTQKPIQLYKKLKLVKPEDYSVNGWGYDQTNYENITLIGQAGGSMILLGKNETYAIAKKKYTNREFTMLDSVRSTDWKPAYSSEEMVEQAMYNAYCGH